MKYVRVLKDFQPYVWEQYFPGLWCSLDQRVQIKTETVIAKLQDIVRNYSLLTPMPLQGSLPHCEPLNSEYCVPIVYRFCIYVINDCHFLPSWVDQLPLGHPATALCTLSGITGRLQNIEEHPCQLLERSWRTGQQPGTYVTSVTGHQGHWSTKAKLIGCVPAVMHAHHKLCHTSKISHCWTQNLQWLRKDGHLPLGAPVKLLCNNR